VFKKFRYQIAIFLSVIGPGLITANVDNDSGGILTYSQAGAKYGYLPLWTLIPITLLLIVTQEMCSRMGAVTGKGLSDLIREEFGLRTTFFMMFALEWFGRKITATSAFVLAGLFAVGFASAGTDTVVLMVGFGMIFFIQLAGNSMQIFCSEVFPTNARASGFALAQGIGRLGTAGIIPAIPWIQKGYGTDAVFVSVALCLVIAAVTVNLIGPETRGRPLDEIAPPEG